MFCLNCGKELPDGSKFCNGCGTAVGEVKKEESIEEAVKLVKTEVVQSTYSERKQEFAGKIIKCPSCGAELQSFTAVCPDCGHEINSQSISISLKEFIDSINEYDKIIASNPEPPKSGWKSWGKGKRFWWIILNLITSFIPMVIYLSLLLIKPFLFPKSVPVLSADEKRKASLIENFTFPNEREATIEAMMFTKSKMAFLASEKFNRKTLFWINLWNTKAEQLNQRASIILKDDKVVESTYANITTSKSKVDNRVKVRAIIGSLIIVAFVTFISINGSIYKGLPNIFNHTPSTSTDNYDDTDYSVTYEWPSTGLSEYLPLPETAYGKIEGDTESRFNIELYQVTRQQFDSYVNKCKEHGFTIVTSKTDSVFYAYNEAQYSLDIFFYEDKNVLEIFLDVPEKMSDFNWPTSGIAKKLPVPKSLVGRVWSDTSEDFGVNIANISQEDFSAYITECMNSGFTIDYKKSDDYFNAFNESGDELTLYFKIFDVMQVHIEFPESD